MAEPRLMWHPTKDACKRLWGRRWVRRITYLLAGGTAFVWTGAWVLERPAVTRWAVAKADALLREETGLSLSIARIELHPFIGSFSADGIALGGDLLTIQRLEARVDPWSLLRGQPRILTLRLVKPHARLSPDRVARIRLKPHPEKKSSTEVVLDLLSVTGGEVEVLEPVWGLPKSRLDFDLKGTGHGPNQLSLALTAPLLKLQGPRGEESGRLDLQADLSDNWLILKESQLKLGASKLKASGAFEPKGGHRLEAKADADLDLAQGFAWFIKGPAPATGRLGLQATAAGTLAQPRWTAKAESRELRPQDRFALAPGELRLQAKGGLSDADLESFSWRSAQGSLEAQGRWTPKEATASLKLGDWTLEPLESKSRVALLHGTRLSADAELKLPGQHPERLEQWEASARGRLAQNGTDAGGFTASLKQGQVQLADLETHLQGLELQAKGGAVLDKKGLVSFSGEGGADLDAQQVALALKAWGIVDLGMAGQTQAQGSVAWTRGGGLSVDGHAEVEQPSWHGATADHFSADASIRGDQLEVRQVHVQKGQGSAEGGLELTWGDPRPGHEAVDMNFTAHQLPAREGLKAADQGDLPIDGIVDGQVRIHGPLDRLVLDGHGQVEGAEVYGISVPAVSTGFNLDIDTLRLKLQDLRIADSLAHLGGEGGKPSGDLALQGAGSLDLEKLTADLRVAGNLDTSLLKLPMPQVQAQLDAHLLGPLASPFGSYALPEGTATIRGGRLYFEEQVLLGLEVDLEHQRRGLEAQVGFERKPGRALALKAESQGDGFAANLAFKISPDTAPAHALGEQLTGGLLQDLRLSLGAQGYLGKEGLRWSGRLDELSGDFGAFDLRQSQPTTLQGTDKGMQLDLGLEGRGHDAAGSSAKATIAGTVPFSMAAPMDLHSAGAMDLGDLKVILDRLLDLDPYSAIGEMRPHGVADYQIWAHGSYADPRADGYLQMQRGRLQLGDYPSLEDLSFKLLLKDRSITLPKEQPLKATLAQGSLNVDGAAQWGMGGLQDYNFNIGLAGFQLRDLPGADGVDVQGGLNLNLKGDAAAGLLKGRVDAERVSYQADIKLSDLILRSALSESGASLADPDDPLQRIALDVDLHLAQPWNFDTNLLKLEGRPEGSFKLLGSLAYPGLKGKMDFLPGGRITNLLPAGDIIIDQGYLNFTDPTTNDPYINMQGSVQVPGYLVNLDIRGTLSNLGWSLNSTPTLTQDEITAILINPDLASSIGTTVPGTSQSTYSSGIASAGSGLLTTLALADLQERVRRLFHLDRVSVSFRTSTVTPTLDHDIQLGKTYNIFDHRVPVLVSQNKSGELTTTAVQVEWRFGGLVMQLGVSKTGDSSFDPAGEIRHTWSPR